VEAVLFDEFLNWQARRYLRETGAEPATTTQASKAMRLRGIANRTGCKTAEQLATLISDRRRVVSLVDAMYLDLAPGTIQTDLVALRHFGEYAVAKGWITNIAIEKNDGPGSRRQKPITVYTDREVELLLTIARARDLRYWMFLTTIADTGRRVSEVLGLEWGHLHLDSSPAHFDLPHTKNRRQAYVPLTTRLRDEVFTPEHIESLKRKGHQKLKRDLSRYPFPFTYQTAEARLRRLSGVAGITHRGYHCFRHTKATEMLARGVPIQAVSALLGHANVVTTDRLYHHATTLDYARYVD
jgi:integrase